jgi:HPt (histidine-containing phosphotransfer) domain-containing protein
MASHHLLSILNDIFYITKIETGQMSFELHSFSLTNIIHHAVSILAPASKEKMLKLTTVISPALAPVYIGDSNQIKQVLLNIISNSIKFTEKGTITIDCAVTGTRDNIHKIRLKVSDTGIGMEEYFAEHIFNKFSQGDISTARRHGGTGLGMAITWELINMMNGTIAVSSKKNVGTVVEINLELETANVSQIVTETDTPVTKKLYNLDNIVRQSRGNPDFVKRMIRLFIEQMPVAVDEIKAALKEGDLETIGKTAHRIKPNIDNFGIEDLKKDIRTIEALAMEGTASAELEVLVERLGNVIRNVVGEL